MDILRQRGMIGEVGRYLICTYIFEATYKVNPYIFEAKRRNIQ